MSDVYLIRHAHAVWLPDEMRPLSPKGHAAAQRVAEQLKDLSVSTIFTSPLTRARQTVEPVAARLRARVIEEADLRERALGRHDGDFLTAVRATWHNFDHRFPGGESNGEAQARMVRAWHRLLAALDGRDGVIATHGNAMALLLKHFDDSVDFAFWHGLSLPDIYRVHVADDGSVLTFTRCGQNSDRRFDSYGNAR